MYCISAINGDRSWDLSIFLHINTYVFSYIYLPKFCNLNLVHKKATSLFPFFLSHFRVSRQLNCPSLFQRCYKGHWRNTWKYALSMQIRDSALLSKEYFERAVWSQEWTVSLPFNIWYIKKYSVLVQKTWTSWITVMFHTIKLMSKSLPKT